VRKGAEISLIQVSSAAPENEQRARLRRSVVVLAPGTETRGSAGLEWYGWPSTENFAPVMLDRQEHVIMQIDGTDLAAAEGQSQRFARRGLCAERSRARGSLSVDSTSGADANLIA
jgi:hypothetical protein